jgi:hypothetical protein
MQGAATLSVLEAKLMAATHCYQDIFYVKKFFGEIRVQVKLPMTTLVDNKGAY